MKKKPLIMKFQDGRYIDLMRQVEREAERDKAIIYDMLILCGVAMVWYWLKTFVF